MAAGEKQGAYRHDTFELRHCPACRFSFVANPWLDFAAIYDEAYYAGRGADPSVDYAFELEHPDRTVRAYEWHGILELVSVLAGVGGQTRWLDFGAGNGGLVRHVRERTGCHIEGFEEGAIATRAAAAGIPMIGPHDLEERAGTFDVVTAIEVVEHVPEPLEALRSMRRLLRPGGLLFLTTGNAEPFRDRLAEWPYVVPEIHVSFFEPCTLAQALELAGFEPRFPGYVQGWTDVIRFKVLKNLGVRRRAVWERALPWPLLARAADRRYRVTAHPVGIAA